MLRRWAAGPWCLPLLLAACSAAPPATPPTGRYDRTALGVVVTPAAGEARKVRLVVLRPDIVRVTTSPTDSLERSASLMVVASPLPTLFEVDGLPDRVRLRTSELRAEVALDTGAVRFFRADGEPLLAAVDSGHFGPVTRDPDGPDPGHYALRQAFQRTPGEALYGLGQHQQGQVDLADRNVMLTTHNLVITIPFLVSSRHYGILWDNDSESRFGRPEPPRPLLQDFELYDAQGRPGGLTARYYDGDRLLLTRVEPDLNYQFLDHADVRQVDFPEPARQARDLRIEWEGSFASREAGDHDLLMYSSGYARLSVDGRLLLDRWRQNWNPWYHTVRLPLTAGERHAIRVDWTPQGGYFRLLHQGPGPETTGRWTSFASDTGRVIDYYVVAGDSADRLIAGYRFLTGKAVLLPRWAYGFWQSRERYRSADELLDALRGYRDRGIPIDNIVLDWSYWPADAWGSHAFDPAWFPDPAGMVEQVHALNAHIMISVWPKFYPSTGHYQQLDAKGYLLKRNIEAGNRDWIAPGYPNAFYDAFNPGARAMYWKQIDDSLNVLGFDAWWLDATEPDMHSNLSLAKREWLMSPNFLGTGAEVFNAYALPHAESVYQGDRAADPGQRVFILTRSGFGGIQRTAAAVWSGDTVSRWSNLREQIAAGIGTAMAGMPNWTFDIGGFTPEDRYRWGANGANGSWQDIDPRYQPEWQELLTRWYQFGAFAPLYRSHGQNPWREIYSIAPEGSAPYESMVWYTKLRYRLLPYIYSQAGDLYHRDGTLMRGLAMDFPGDAVAGELADEYLFGPALLVAPVYEMGARTRRVYLPRGADWYDFYTGQRYPGGQTVEAAAPLQRMPLFVRAGSIVPSGPAIQYAAQELNADLTLNVYPGADGAFDLYEDDGTSYAYEEGQWSRIPVRWDEATRTLTIGSRQGGFEGMAPHRTLRVRWIEGPDEAAADFDRGLGPDIEYDGSPVTVPGPARPGGSRPGG